jgi:hypothetical protein
MLLTSAMREFVLILALGVSGLLSAATLEKLSMDDMVKKSTDIVCATVTGTSSFVKGPLIYTRYRIQVSQRWKGAEASQMDIAVPGGQYGIQNQIFSGAPKLQLGKEYMLYLWTSRSGITQVIGLSQGLFGVTRNSQGVATISRAAGTEMMLDRATGQPVTDQSVRMPLEDVAATISRILHKSN